MEPDSRLAGRGEAPRPATTSGAFPVPRPGAAFAVLGVVQAMLTAAISLTLLALPAIERDLRLSDAELVLVSTAPGLSISGLLLLGGRLTDMFGWRRMFITGLVIFGAASALAAVAPTGGMLLMARFGQGCGGALAAPAAMALLGAVYPDPQRRTRAVAVWGNLSPAGATAGVLLSGAIVTWAPWRWVFALPVLVAIIGALAAPRLLPAGPPLASMRLDIPGAVLATSGLTLFSFGLVRIGEYAWSSPAVLLPVVGGGALLAAFVTVEAAAREPLLPLSFFASPRRAAALLAMLVAGAVSASTFFMLALYFLRVRGWTPLATSAAFLPFAVALFVTGAMAGRLIGRGGARVVTVSGLAIGAAGLLLLSRLDVASPFAGALLAGQIVFQIGSGLAFAGSTVMAVAGVPEDDAGLAGGVVNTIQQIGPTVGLALLISLASAYTVRLENAGVGEDVADVAGYAFALGIAAAVFVLAALLATVVMRPRREAGME